jgi:hypothetical protein
MFIHRPKPEQSKKKDFFIGEVPSRPGRRQIDLENLVADQSQAATHARIGEFNTVSGYHPVRPAININDKPENDLSGNDPYNTNRILLVNSNPQRHHHFWQRKSKR